MLIAITSVAWRDHAPARTSPAPAPSGTVAEPCANSWQRILWDEASGVRSPADDRRLQALRIRVGSRRHTWFDISQVEALMRGVPV